jgi:hypothetical protein
MTAPAQPCLLSQPPPRRRATHCQRCQSAGAAVVASLFLCAHAGLPLPLPVRAEGRGVVLDPHTVEVRAADGSVRQLRTKRILVATGGRAVKPPIPGAVRILGVWGVTGEMCACQSAWVATLGGTASAASNHRLSVPSATSSRLVVPGAGLPPSTSRSGICCLLLLVQDLGITSDEALVLDNVPAGGTIAIIGGGYIAVEFAGGCSGCFENNGGVTMQVVHVCPAMGVFQGSQRHPCLPGTRSAASSHPHLCFPT